MKRLAASAVVAALGLYGLFAAAGASSGGGYALGLLLFVASVLFVFAMIKQHFDGVPEERALDLWPERRRNAFLQFVLLGALAVVGLLLFLADGDVYLRWFGLSLLVVSGVMAVLAARAMLARTRRRGAERS